MMAHMAMMGIAPKKSITPAPYSPLLHIDSRDIINSGVLPPDNSSLASIKSIVNGYVFNYYAPNSSAQATIQYNQNNGHPVINFTNSWYEQTTNFSDALGNVMTWYVLYKNNDVATPAPTFYITNITTQDRIWLTQWSSDANRFYFDHPVSNRAVGFPAVDTKTVYSVATFRANDAQSPFLQILHNNVSIGTRPFYSAVSSFPSSWFGDGNFKLCMQLAYNSAHSISQMTDVYNYMLSEFS